MKKMHLFFTMFLLALLIIPACQTTKVDINAEAIAIRNLEDQWTVALQTSDIEKIISFFAPEAVAMSPNSPICVGLQAIRGKNESQFADTTLLYKTYSSTIDIINVSSSGDLAYVRGSDRISTKTPNGLVEEKSKWIDIWKKINGEWKVIVNIWNSDMPLSGK